MDFTTNDECGLLVEGYEHRPMILQPWHPPYYRELLESQGMAKKIDLLMWWLEMGGQSDRGAVPPDDPRSPEGPQGARRDDPRTCASATSRPRWAGSCESTTRPGSDNWGFVPITEEEVAFQAGNLKPILREEWASWPSATAR